MINVIKGFHQGTEIKGQIWVPGIAWPRLRSKVQCLTCLTFGDYSGLAPKGMWGNLGGAWQP